MLNAPFFISAYGLAVKRGFTGTEVEFLKSLGITSITQNEDYTLTIVANGETYTTAPVSYHQLYDHRMTVTAKSDGAIFLRVRTSVINTSAAAVTADTLESTGDARAIGKITVGGTTYDVLNVNKTASGLLVSYFSSGVTLSTYSISIDNVTVSDNVIAL